MSVGVAYMDKVLDQQAVIEGLRARVEEQAMQIATDQECIAERNRRVEALERRCAKEQRRGDMADCLVMNAAYDRAAQTAGVLIREIDEDVSLDALADAVEAAIRKLKEQSS